MGFINLITIDDYIKESENSIYKAYGIKKEELQRIEQTDFQKLVDKIIDRHIGSDFNEKTVKQRQFVKGYKGIGISADGGIDKYINYISEEYGTKKAEGKISVFLNDMKDDITRLIVEVYNYDYFDIWRDFYLLIKYTSMKDKRYDAYENGSYFSSVEINNLPFTIHNQDSYFPCFGRELQRNLYNENINIFSELYGRGEDITRYGFGITQSIIEYIEQSIYINEQENNLEELLLIDVILGVSLTNNLFWYVKSASKEKWESIMKVTKTLALIKSVEGRNLIGRMIGMYMLASKFDNQVIGELCSFLESRVSSFNQCFEDLKQINIISTYDEKEQEEILGFLEELLLKSGYFINCEDSMNYVFFKMKNIGKRLCDKKRIKVSKIKKNEYELYACIHRAVIQGIVEINRGSAKI